MIYNIQNNSVTFKIIIVVQFTKNKYYNKYEVFKLGINVETLCTVPHNFVESISPQYCYRTYTFKRTTTLIFWGPYVTDADLGSFNFVNWSVKTIWQNWHDPRSGQWPRVTGELDEINVHSFGEECMIQNE